MSGMLPDDDDDDFTWVIKFIALNVYIWIFIGCLAAVTGNIDWNPS